MAVYYRENRGRTAFCSLNGAESTVVIQFTTIFRSTHFADPLWHRVGAWGAVVGVDDNDGDDDGGNDKHHGEEHVLPDERHSTGGRRDELHNDQQEHSQRQQDGDAESHLLAWRTQWTIFTAVY